MIATCCPSPPCKSSGVRSCWILSILRTLILYLWPAFFWYPFLLFFLKIITFSDCECSSTVARTCAFPMLGLPTAVYSAVPIISMSSSRICYPTSKGICSTIILSFTTTLCCIPRRRTTAKISSGWGGRVTPKSASWTYTIGSYALIGPYSASLYCFSSLLRAFFWRGSFHALLLFVYSLFWTNLSKISLRSSLSSSLKNWLKPEVWYCQSVVIDGGLSCAALAPSKLPIRGLKEPL